MKRVTVAGCQHVRFSSSIPRAKFDNRKHIHESEFSTFHFQSKLKKQPIPDLDSSGQQRKYYITIQTVATAVVVTNWYRCTDYSVTFR